MKISERIAEAIAGSGMSKSAIAKHCGVSPSAVTQWLNSDTKAPTAENLLKLSRATGYSYSWLVDGRGDKLVRHTGAVQANAELDTDAHIGGPSNLLATEIEVPYYREVELAGGSGKTEVIENHGAVMRLPREAIERAGVPINMAACATLRGDSMFPRIQDGAAIGIDRSVDKIVDGEIFAFDHDGMLRVKYLYRLPYGRIRIASENTVEHPDEILGPDDMPYFRLIGWVFWWQTVQRRPSAF